MGAPFGNCNACKSGSHGRRKSYFTKSDFNHLSREKAPSLLSKRHKGFLESWKKASKRYGVSGSYKFIKNLQRSVPRARFMSQI